MTTRRKKLQRVLEVREQALEKQATALAQSRTQLQHAVTEVERESERLIEAAQHRSQLASEISNVSSWIEAEQWLQHRRTLLGKAHSRVISAEAVVQEGVKRVVAARIDKKKIEVLDERLAVDQLRVELRSEQKLSDEFGLRRRDGERHE